MALAAPASARYLHISDAEGAAQEYIGIYGSDESLNTTLGHCWRGGGPHVLQCGFTGSDFDGLSPFASVGVITVRGNRLYGHVIGMTPDGHATPGNQPRFIGRLTP